MGNVKKQRRARAICHHGTNTSYLEVNNELTYLAGAHAMHTGEDESETNTNSLEVNDDLKYLAGANAMHTVEEEGETNTNSLEVNDQGTLN